MSEKGTLLSETQNKFIFQVEKQSNKLEIKKAIEEKLSKLKNITIKSIEEVSRIDQSENNVINFINKKKLKYDFLLLADTRNFNVFKENHFFTILQNQGFKIYATIPNSFFKLGLNFKFDNDDVGADLGQSARVVASGAAGNGVLTLPLAAVTAEGDERYVWAVNPADSSLIKTPVETGAYGAETIPVLSGLQADTWVVAAGTHLLREGQTVIPVDRQNRQIEIVAADTRSPADDAETESE